MATPVGYAEIAVEYKHNADPDPWYNIFGVAVDLATHSATEHVDHIAGVWYGLWQDQLPPAVALNNVIGRFGQDGGPDVIVETTVAPLNGTSAAAKLPQNCALLVRKQTNLGGRRGRGRMFFPSVLNEDQISDFGTMDPAVRGAYQALVDSLLEDLAAPDVVSGAETPMVLLHNPVGVSPAPGTPTVVQALIADSTISTQRRRLR